MLAEHRATVWHCTFDEALRHLYQDFRSWTHMNRASCSHRLWRAKHLHIENHDGVSTFPWLNAKAYNARVILAWLAATSFKFLTHFLLQFFFALLSGFPKSQPCPTCATSGRAESRAKPTAFAVRWWVGPCVGRPQAVVGFRDCCCVACSQPLLFLFWGNPETFFPWWFLIAFILLNRHVYRCSWAEWQRLSELYPRYLNDAQASHLHDLGMQCIHLYNFSAAVAATQGRLRWHVLPKLHIFHHMILDLPLNFQNVRAFHCFSGEDYMGFLKQICLSTCTASNMEKRVLKRALLKCMAQCKASISALKWSIWGWMDKKVRRQPLGSTWFLWFLNPGSSPGPQFQWNQSLGAGYLR